MSDDSRQDRREFDEEALEEDWHESEPMEFKRRRPRKRPFWISLIVIAIVIYLMVSMRRDLLYNFADIEDVDLGNVVGFAGTEQASDTFVSVTGIRNPSRGIRLDSLFADRHVFQMMGTKKVFVETSVEDDEKSEGLAEKTFYGRLKRLGELSYYNTIRDFAAYNFGIDVEKEYILVRSGDKPGEQWGILGVYGLLLLVLVFNIVILIRRILK